MSSTVTNSGFKGIRILVADDDIQMQVGIRASLERSGFEVVVAGDGLEALSALEQESFDALITDQRMPTMNGLALLKEIQRKEMSLPVILITAYGTINQAVEAMQLGAADFITKPFSAEDLARSIERVINPEHRQFRARSKKARRGRPIITNDPRMIRVLEVAEAVARSDATVLIQGESGTGKELMARLVHSSSPRAEQPFVAVNCAALPENLLESELFGHEKGAFTGAQVRKLGKFELAHGGTILLDEISEMALTLQAKLLRVIQEREVDRVGGREPVAIDVRVLATTNRRLEDMVTKGLFRADLFYRLNVIPLTIPSLRERKGDIRLLVDHFMKHYLGEKAPLLPPNVLSALEEYPWPGNIRELQNAVERAAILAGGQVPKESDFLLAGAQFDIDFSAVAKAPDGVIHDNSSADQKSLASEIQIIRSGMTVSGMEKALIMATLKATSENRTEAAKLLGISVRTLRNKLNEYREGGEIISDG